MTAFFAWATAEDPQDLVHQVVQQLVEGGLVVLPTGTVYELAALASHPAAVANLANLTKQAQLHSASSAAVPAASDATVSTTTVGNVALALAQPDRCDTFVQPWTAARQRLAQRCFPGPLTLIFASNATTSNFQKLAPAAQNLLQTEAGIPLRIPRHPALAHCLRLLPAPLLLAEQFLPDGALALHPEQLFQQWQVAQNAPDAVSPHWQELANQVSSLVADGVVSVGAPATVFAVDQNDQLQLLREGSVTAERVQRLMNQIIVFVCTGNTCRSPMAEAIAKRMLADKLHCQPQQLPELGFTILSAGVAAAPGASAARHAMQVVREFNAQLDDHLAQPLNTELAQIADQLIVMTRDHRDHILSIWPNLADKTILLGGNQDVADPVGLPLEEYRNTANQMVGYLKIWLDTLRAPSQSAESN